MDVAELRGLAFLAWLTFRRQLRTLKFAAAVVLVAILVLSSLAWKARRAAELQRQAKEPVVRKLARDLRPARLIGQGLLAAIGKPAAEPLLERSFQPTAEAEFTRRVLLPGFIGFLLPILTLLFGTAAAADDRDDRTFVYLLTRPLTLWKVYLAKAVGIAPLSVGLPCAALFGMCWAAGEPGERVFAAFALPLALAAACYGCLFLLIGAALPRPYVVGVGFTFFAEFLVGNLPGTLKRLTVSYHARNLMIANGEPLGFKALFPAQFVPMPGENSLWALGLGCGCLLLLGAWVFHRREYRDLTA